MSTHLPSSLPSHLANISILQGCSSASSLAAKQKMPEFTLCCGGVGRSHLQKDCAKDYVKITTVS